MYYSEICKRCDKCIEKCPKNCIKPDNTYGLVIDEEKCNKCGICVDACYYGARKLMNYKNSLLDPTDINKIFARVFHILIKQLQ